MGRVKRKIIFEESLNKGVFEENCHVEKLRSLVLIRNFSKNFLKNFLVKLRKPFVMKQRDLEF